MAVVVFASTKRFGIRVHLSIENSKFSEADEIAKSLVNRARVALQDKSVILKNYYFTDANWAKIN
jgi:hypothetical protein